MSKQKRFQELMQSTAMPAGGSAVVPIGFTFSL
jgi:hypothetical protein